MKIYIVQSENWPSASEELTREQKILTYKDQLRQFRKLIEDFSTKHPNKLNILAEAWIDCSLKIEAEPDVAGELKKIQGLTVREPSPLVRTPHFGPF